MSVSKDIDSKMTRIAVVTGANKGIGLAIVKGLCKRFNGVVYLTARDNTRGRNAVAELKKLDLHPEYHQLDVSDPGSVEKFRDFIKKKHGGLDILINNAAVLDSRFITTYENSKEVIDINYKSILTIQELIFPLVRDNGRILNISSSCGHLSNLKNKHWLEKLSRKDITMEDINEFVEWFLESKKNGTFNPDNFIDSGNLSAYKTAKIALSALTVVQQRELESRNIAVNSMHPGLVRTDLSINLGDMDVEESAITPLYLVLDAPQSLKGAYVWHDGTIVDWYDYNAPYNYEVKMVNRTE